MLYERSISELDFKMQNKPVLKTGLGKQRNYLMPSELWIYLIVTFWAWFSGSERIDNKIIENNDNNDNRIVTMVFDNSLFTEDLSHESFLVKSQLSIKEIPFWQDSILINDVLTGRHWLSQCWSILPAMRNNLLLFSERIASNNSIAHIMMSNLLPCLYFVSEFIF